MNRKEFLLASSAIARETLGKLWRPILLSIVVVFSCLFVYNVFLDPVIAVSTLGWLLALALVIALVVLIREVNKRILETLNDKLSESTKSKLNLLAKALHAVELVMTIITAYFMWQKDAIMVVIVFLIIAVQYWLQRGSREYGE